MKQINVFGWVALVLVACAAPKDGEVAPRVQVDQNMVERQFRSLWCDKEDQLSLDASYTVGLLIAASGKANCSEAATVLARSETLVLEDTRVEFPVADLRPLMALKQIRYLSLIGLDMSQAATLRPLQALPNLEGLDLSYNSFENVAGLGRYAPELKYLNLSHNATLGTKSNKAFSTLELEKYWKGLVKLDVSNCNWANVPGALPPSLKQVNLRGNKFQKGAFDSLKTADGTYLGFEVVEVQEAFGEGFDKAELDTLRSWMPKGNVRAFDAKE